MHVSCLLLLLLEKIKLWKFETPSGQNESIQPLQGKLNFFKFHCHPINFESGWC